MIVQVAFYELGLVGEAFSYELPESFIEPGEMLLGKQVGASIANVKRRGVIVADEGGDVDIEKIQSVDTVLENTFGALLTPWQCNLALWMAKYYIAPFHKVARLFIPEKIWMGTYNPQFEHIVKLHPDRPPLSARAKTLLQIEEKLLGFQEGMYEEELAEVVSKSSIRTAIQKNVIQKIEGKLLSVLPSDKISRRDPYVLTKEQHKIVESILQSKNRKFLIHGVTGAGKTEMYVHLALDAKQKGEETLLLVPEIALTPQLVTYFQSVFGERIAVFHSRLSAGEKHQEWVRVQRGDVDVIIGSRSAMFAPFPNLGMIIIDEEHEWTYKNEQHPRYASRSVCEKIVEILPEVKLVLGSATPSVETMYTYRNTIDSEVHTLDKKYYQQEQRI